MASARPRLIYADEMTIDAQRLLAIPSPRFQDYRIVAQLELSLAVCTLFPFFGWRLVG